MKNSIHKLISCTLFVLLVSTFVHADEKAELAYQRLIAKKNAKKVAQEELNKIDKKCEEKIEKHVKEGKIEIQDSLERVTLQTEAKIANTIQNVVTNQVNTQSDQLKRENQRERDNLKKEFDGKIKDTRRVMQDTYKNTARIAENANKNAANIAENAQKEAQKNIKQEHEKTQKVLTQNNKDTQNIIIQNRKENEKFAIQNRKEIEKFSLENRKELEKIAVENRKELETITAQNRKELEEFTKKMMDEKKAVVKDLVNEVVTVLKDDPFQYEIGINPEKIANQITESLAEGGELDNAFNKTRQRMQNEMDGISDHASGILTKLSNQLGVSVARVSAGAAVGVVLMTTGYYGPKIGYHYVYKKVINPAPVGILDSSKKSLWQKIKSWWQEPEQAPKMVFTSALEFRINKLIAITKNVSEKTKKGATNIFYQNVLLYGPPGVGKSMLGKKWAHEADLEFIYVTAVAFFQNGIEWIDQLFEWAAKSKKGLLIFIDEADSLVTDRTTMRADSNEYRVVNHVLSHLGTRSNKFMIVMATNHIDHFDNAMHRRIDEFVHIGLPEEPERAKIITLYRDQILLDEKNNDKVFVASAKKVLTTQKIATIAKKTAGLCSGDLSGIVNAVKLNADTVGRGCVTERIVDSAVQQAIEKHKAFKGLTK